MTTWWDVWPEHQRNIGFAEGPTNLNPWGPEQGVHNQSYCASAQSMVNYHHGVRWWPDSQFGEKGYAYCPYLESGSKKHGIWEQQLGVTRNIDLIPSDLVLFSWGRNGVADHVEVVVAVYADGTYDTIGYNTGHPEGCHLVRRDRKYLLGRCRISAAFYTKPQPVPSPIEPNRVIYDLEDTVRVAITEYPIPDMGANPDEAYWDLDGTPGRPLVKAGRCMSVEINGADTTGGGGAGEARPVKVGDHTRLRFRGFAPHSQPTVIVASVED